MHAYIVLFIILYKKLPYYFAKIALNVINHSAWSAIIVACVIIIKNRTLSAHMRLSLLLVAGKSHPL